MRLGQKTRVLLAGFAGLVLSIATAGQISFWLAPPADVKVAVVLFQDLQWPDCASAYPTVREVARTRNVPVILHDFPLPRHNWSYQAAVNARYFGLQSQQLGDEFRGYILQNQSRITDEAVLRQFTERFAAEHQMRLPAAFDSDGKLAELVHRDFLLGQRIGMEHTPTIFVVSHGAVSPALVGPVNRERLSQLIELLQKNAKPATPAWTPSLARPRRD
jgi:protein-disulfide isomerase